MVSKYLFDTFRRRNDYAVILYYIRGEGLTVFI